LIHIGADHTQVMANAGSSRMERLSSILRRRGIVAPAFESYGGLSGLIDYGPVGASIRRRVINSWTDYWVSSGDISEIESPTLTPEQVLIASGHVGEFNDLMTTCGGCESVFRADHLIEEAVDNAEALNADEVNSVLASNDIKCPGCGASDWLDTEPMNLMFKTSVGAMGRGRIAYLRPETAQGMFMQYPLLYRHFKQKLPFGGVQTGKGYRNEISPRQGMIRLREFTMAELEYFFDPLDPPTGDDGAWGTEVVMIPNGGSEAIQISIGDAQKRGIVLHPTVGWFLARTLELVLRLGADVEKIRFRQHENDEMAHYATDCWDLELLGEHGWVECVGIANRTCHDLDQHAHHSGRSDFRAWRSFDEPKTIEVDKWFPVQSSIGPVFKNRAKMVTDAIEAITQPPVGTPFLVELEDGTTVTVEDGMAERRTEIKKTTGEWYTPHVVEPAFGIDRIIWHLIDHSYVETENEGDWYTMLRLPQLTAPYDAVVLPLFDKDGMGKMSREVRQDLSRSGLLKMHYDDSRSIGRRYARADEIGIPWAITVDHQSLEDGTVTVRKRDDGSQVRVATQDLESMLVQSKRNSDVF